MRRLSPTELLVVLILTPALGGIMTHQVEFNNSLVDDKDRDHFEGVYKDLVRKKTSQSNNSMTPLEHASLPHSSGWLAFELKQHNSTSMYIQFEQPFRHIIHSLHGTNKTELLPRISVDYQLLSTELAPYNSELFCQHKPVKYFLVQSPETQAQFCQNELFMFAEPLDQGGWLPEHQGDLARRHCPLRHINFSLMDLVDMGDISVSLDLDGLLPHQQYAINFKVSMPKDYGGVTKKEDYKCLSESEPLFAPQADLTSFSYNTDKSEELKEGYEIVKLYWRRLPTMIASSKEFHYEVLCKEGDSNNNQTYLVKKESGRIVIDKLIDQMLDCRVRTKNHLGYSNRSSRITVPRRSDLLSLGPQFRFVGYAQPNQRFLLEWTPFKVNATTRQIEVLPRDSMEVNNPGYIVIYWCSLSYLNLCDELSGMIRLNSSLSAHTLQFPPRNTVAHRLFGIAYMLSEPNISTGIVWARCGAVSEQDFTLRALQIMTRTVANDSYQSLSVSWMFPKCDSVISGISSYEINYCKADSLDGCSSIWRDPTLSDFKSTKYKFENESELCKTRRIPNKFFDEETISDLEPATTYNIRMRYILKNGTTSSWSEPTSFYTGAHPEVLASCWHSYLIFAMILFIASSILGAVGYIRYSRAYQYWIFVCEKFDRTCENVPKNVNMRMEYDPDEITVKYTINKGKCGDPDELTMSMLGLSEPDCDQQDYRRRVGAINGHSHCDDQSFAYVPRELVEGSNDLAAPMNDIASERCVATQEYEENSTEQDEISINSHSSFLNTILNEQLDLINTTCQRYKVDQAKRNT